MTQILANVALPIPLIGRDAPAFDGPVRAGCRVGDLIVQNGRATGLRPSATDDSPRILMPALVDAHVHLDKCHTIDRLTGIGGDLSAAIAAQHRDKARWSPDDIRRRAGRGLRDLQQAGCDLARSHVDWGDTTAPPPAWSVLHELRQDWDGHLDLSALCGVDQLADRAMGTAIAQSVARSRGSLGAFVLDQPDRGAGIRAAFDLADRFGLALDFHVDEGLGSGLDGIELIARAAIDTGFQGPVLCGHLCALMNRQGADLDRVIDLIAQAGIHVAALPVTNLYLQGRRAGTPDRRGVTRTRELMARGVPVVVGSDNVGDAFCPLGQHDPMAALHLAALAGHLDPPFERWLPMITDHAARALGRPPRQIAGSTLPELRLSPAADLATLVSGRAGPLRAPTPADCTGAPS
ncbi:MAG: amidohydrolase family protein [Marinibacterium sp.]|nr:amidohydrolase family protein [Marinibacterium sp.]